MRQFDLADVTVYRVDGSKVDLKDVAALVKPFGDDVLTSVRFFPMPCYLKGIEKNRLIIVTPKSTHIIISF